MVPHCRRLGGAGFFAGFAFACMILISFVVTMQCVSSAASAQLR
jgi:hypothetical protein